MFPLKGPLEELWNLEPIDTGEELSFGVTVGLATILDKETPFTYKDRLDVPAVLEWTQQILYQVLALNAYEGEVYGPELVPTSKYKYEECIKTQYSSTASEVPFPIIEL